MSIVNVENITHGFGDRTLFREVSFRLLTGEHVGLVGANGVGKSTLISFITGQMIADEGKIEWAPRVKIGYLDQHAKLTPGKTIRDILKDAFKDLYDLEAVMLEITDQMADATPAQLEVLLIKMGNIQEQLEASGFYSLHAKVDEMAHGLGLTSIGMEKEVQNLSGGQRTKVLLAKLLLEQPTALLLDEPTNFLDSEHITWLVNYLKSYPHSFILISHDTDFMNRVVNRIYHIEFGRLTRYIGNYEEFLKLSELKKSQYIDQYNRQQGEIKKLEDFVSKNIARASTTNRAKSRQKKLEKIDRLEKPTKGIQPSFQFLEARTTGKKVVSCEEIRIGYDRPLLPPLSLEIERGQKIAIIGCNGVGKTTLLKTLMGDLKPLNGNVEHGEFLHPAYFEQEVHVSNNRSALEEIWEYYPHLTQQEVRANLARCGLKSEHIMQKMSALSGGEQAKVRLCKLMLTESNWILFDEPTNHLDVISKEALKQALKSYKGSILLVCHEPQFYEGWVTKTWDVEQWSNEKLLKR